jgi:hypothetical protein
MGSSILFIGIVVFVAAASVGVGTPIILRQIALQGVYTASCIGFPTIEYTATVTVSADDQHLILYDQCSIVIIPCSNIQSVMYDNAGDGLHRLLILWSESGSETFSELVFNSRQDARRVAWLMH